MMKKLSLPLICLSCLMVFSCGEDTIDEDITAPMPPELVEKSVEYAMVENGIDAVPGGNWIYLQWDPNTEDDLAGYQIWRMAEDDTNQTFLLLQNLSLTQLTSIEQPEFTDMSPEVAPNPFTGFGRGYYYYITAYDDMGNQSAASDTAYYKLLKKPQSLSVDADLDTVRWSYPIAPEEDVYFVLRIVRVPSGDYVWITRYYNFQDPFAVPYNFDGSAIGFMGSGKYYFRVDVSYLTDYGDLYNGAESNLLYYTVE